MHARERAPTWRTSKDKNKPCWPASAYTTWWKDNSSTWTSQAGEHNPKKRAFNKEQNKWCTKPDKEWCNVLLRCETISRRWTWLQLEKRKSCSCFAFFSLSLCWGVVAPHRVQRYHGLISQTQKQFLFFKIFLFWVYLQLYVCLSWDY